MASTGHVESEPVPLWATATVAAFAAVLPTLVTSVYFVALWDFPPAVQQSAYAGGKVFQFGLPLAWLLLVERRRPRRPRPGAADGALAGPAGQRPRRWWVGMGEGVGFGALVLAAALVLYNVWLGPMGVFDRPIDAMRAKLIGFGVDTLTRYVAFALFVSIVHAGLEEYYFRWFVFGQMRRLMRLGPALLLSGLAFGAHHVLVLAMYFGWDSPWTWGFSAAVAIGGVYWAWLYERTGSLVGPWLSHILADVAIFTIGYELLATTLR